LDRVIEGARVDLILHVTICYWYYLVTASLRLGGILMLITTGNSADVGWFFVEHKSYQEEEDEQTKYLLPTSRPYFPADPSNYRHDYADKIQPEMVWSIYLTARRNLYLAPQLSEITFKIQRKDRKMEKTLRSEWKTCCVRLVFHVTGFIIFFCFRCLICKENQLRCSQMLLTLDSDDNWPSFIAPH